MAFQHLQLLIDRPAGCRAFRLQAITCVAGDAIEFSAKRFRVQGIRFYGAGKAHRKARWAAVQVGRSFPERLS